jgi:hypothetical protein
LIPPKHDLRGGNASEDSNAMSSNILKASMNRCFLAVNASEGPKDSNDGYYISQELGPAGGSPLDGSRFRGVPDISQTFFAERESEITKGAGRLVQPVNTESSTCQWEGLGLPSP